MRPDAVVRISDGEKKYYALTLMAQMYAMKLGATTVSLAVCLVALQIACGQKRNEVVLVR